MFINLKKSHSSCKNQTILLCTLSLLSTSSFHPRSAVAAGRIPSFADDIALAARLRECTGRGGGTAAVVTRAVEAVVAVPTVLGTGGWPSLRVLVSGLLCVKKMANSR